MHEAGNATRAERAARNQSLFREVNERLQTLAQTFQEIAQAGSFACECAEITCVAQMELTMDEYEALRAHPNRFAVLPGHEIPEVERTVAANERYVVIEKIGEGARIAADAYPRS